MRAQIHTHTHTFSDAQRKQSKESLNIWKEIEQKEWKEKERVQMNTDDKIEMFIFIKKNILIRNKV